MQVGVKKSGSSSHGDTVGEESSFGVTNNGDTNCSYAHKPSKNSMSSKYCNWFSKNFNQISNFLVLKKLLVYLLLKLIFESGYCLFWELPFVPLKL